MNFGLGLCIVERTDRQKLLCFFLINIWQKPFTNFSPYPKFKSLFLFVFLEIFVLTVLLLPISVTETLFLLARSASKKLNLKGLT